MFLENAYNNSFSILKSLFTYSKQAYWREKGCTFVKGGQDYFNLATWRKNER